MATPEKPGTRWEVGRRELPLPIYQSCPALRHIKIIKFGPVTWQVAGKMGGGGQLVGGLILPSVLLPFWRLKKEAAGGK